MSEALTCQNCKTEFTIAAEDFGFYEKIKVPPPTFCPECRTVRRMAWRNERTLYKRKCAMTDKEVISCFAPDSGVTVYDRDVWWSDKWDPLEYGKEYDFSRPFFEQYKELFYAVPLPAVFNARAVQSDYTNHSGSMKNCYLIFACWDCENMMYANKAIGCKDSLDVLGGGETALSYEVVDSVKISKNFFVENSENCTDSWFLYECRGCNNCFGCTNLRNKSYYIFNQPYSREEYFKKLEEFNLGSYASLTKLKARFEELKHKALRRYANIYNCQDSTGDNISNLANCRECFDLRTNCRDSKFCINGGMGMNDIYDGYGIGANLEMGYEIVDTGDKGSRFYFDVFVWGGNDVSYSYACHANSNLFGCVGLRGKQYCILNRQYTKEDYEALLPRIIQHMKEMPYIQEIRNSKNETRNIEYKYGEFFPTEMSPFGYNETIAQEYFPVTEAAAKERGYKWRNPDTKSHAISLAAADLPDHIKDVTDNITKEVIGCANSSPDSPGTGGRGPDLTAAGCTKAFKIVPAELEFYKRMNLPLPRLCPNCRHYARLKQRNPVKLWSRNCMCAGKQSSSGSFNNIARHSHGESACANAMQSSYAPERPEVIYCDACYNAELA